jgi:myo-inositol-1(or 4)-monophosphatase
LHQYICEKLAPTLLPILSEEGDGMQVPFLGGFRWVLDPLDGTYNYLRGIGPSTISLALEGSCGVCFGVVGVVGSSTIYHGGKGIGAYRGAHEICVSKEVDLASSVIMTGFPSRGLRQQQIDTFANGVYSKFSKVRMIGSASRSLLYVSEGRAEVYFENGIMIWDIAAGISILQGAGGNVVLENCDIANGVNVVATNGRVKLDENKK